jgi:butyrate kinase
VFLDERPLFKKTIDHHPGDLPGRNVQDQLGFRRDTVLDALAQAGIPVEDTDLFVGRGGGVVNTCSGTYLVNDKLLEHASVGILGQHPAQLASQICAQLRDRYGGEAFVVNPPDVDEFIDAARVTGIKGVYRPSQIHALNQKEVAIRYCVANGKPYADVNLIVAHMGGGISVTAHKKGRMIDSNNILKGDGPMTPTRCGAVPATQVMDLCFSGRYTEKELREKAYKNGGLTDLLGTADAREIERRIEACDSFAELCYHAMIYQIGKCVGSCAAALHGEVEAIILTGGLAYSAHLIDRLRAMIQWIAPVTVMAGEFEMEALAAGALRVVRGEEQAVIYTGTPVWEPPKV